MARLLHTADTHLGYRQYHLSARSEDFRAAFERVARDAVEAEVDAVVHAGDLFHDRQPALSDVMDAMSVLRVLDRAEIPFYGIVGNHEAKRDRQWLDLFSEMGLATRLDETPTVVGEVALYGLDFVGRAQREGFEPAFESPPPSVSRTALVTHGLFEPFDHGDWDARELLAASSVEFDAMLLGDDHTPARRRIETPTETWLTYPGSTERASASERDQRGYNLVTLDEEVDIRRRGLETREFVFVDLELRDGEGTERVLRRLGEHDLTDAVVVVTLTGDGERVTPADIEAEATERGALVARVNDRREREDEETRTEIKFADPDRAVERRIQELGLSEAARSVDETVRASKVADSNVADAVEDRVAELVETSDAEAFEPAAESDLDASTDDEPETASERPESEEAGSERPEQAGETARERSDGGQVKQDSAPESETTEADEAASDQPDRADGSADDSSAADGSETDDSGQEGESGDQQRTVGEFT
jgi:DNA repair exonuclease SbcCD nuclease subunit